MRIDCAPNKTRCVLLVYYSKILVLVEWTSYRVHEVQCSTIRPSFSSSSFVNELGGGGTDTPATTFIFASTIQDNVGLRIGVTVNLFNCCDLDSTNDAGYLSAIPSLSQRLVWSRPTTSNLACLNSKSKTCAKKKKKTENYVYFVLMAIATFRIGTIITMETEVSCTVARRAS